MNTKNSDYVPEFVEYNDNNLEHVEAGPDYGQTGSRHMGWTELDSSEYPDYVEEITNRIFHHQKIRIVH